MDMGGTINASPQLHYDRGVISTASCLFKTTSF